LVWHRLTLLLGFVCFPALTDYPVTPGAGLFDILQQRLGFEPFNAVATPASSRWPSRIRSWLRGNRPRTASGAAFTAPAPPAIAEKAGRCRFLHFAGEVEVIFGSG
jgi:hypothetical protein